jgi:hypothetical protein
MHFTIQLVVTAALIAISSTASAGSTRACVSNFYATNGCPGNSIPFFLDYQQTVSGPSSAAANTGPQSGHFTTSGGALSGYTSTTSGYNGTFMGGGYFEDTVSFTSANLAVGALIPVRVDLELVGTFTAGGSGGTNGGLLPRGSAGINIGGLAWGALYDDFDMNWGGPSPHSTGLSKRFDTFVANGSSHGLFSRMDIGSTASANWYSTASFEGHVYITPSMPGVTVHSVSGFSYTVPAVPEPETYAMMLAGLGLLGVAARRRRQFPTKV